MVYLSKAFKYGRLILSAFLLCLLLGVKAEKKKPFPGGKYYLYRIYFTNKKASPYSLQSPEAYLSAKSLQRRAHQAIFVDSTDLPVSPAYIQGIHKKGYPIVCKSKWNNTVVIRSNTAITSAAFADLSYVKQIKKVFTTPDSIPEAENFSSYRKNLQPMDITENSVYGAGKAQILSLRGERLHDAGFRGNGISIAVLDAGFANVDNMNAFQSVKIKGVRNFVDGLKREDVYSVSGHGTKVLSAMALNEKNVFVGTAPEADYWLFRTEDIFSESMVEEDYWVAATEYADSLGIDIVSSSLGYHHYAEKSDSYRYADLDGQKSFISRAASLLAHKGIILVNSAGNDGMGQWKKINVPADAFDIITVGAVSQDSVNAAFSSIGPTADGRVKPDVMTYGCPAHVVSARGWIIPDVGTSFATPIVAGLVACLWQSMPEKSALEIIDYVRKSGNNAATPDNINGYGIPDFWKAYMIGRNYSINEAHGKE